MNHELHLWALLSSIPASVQKLLSCRLQQHIQRKLQCRAAMWISHCSRSCLLDAQLRSCSSGAILIPVAYSISLTALSFYISGALASWPQGNRQTPSLTHGSLSHTGIIINHWVPCHNEKWSWIQIRQPHITLLHALYISVLWPFWGDWQ